MIGQDTYSVKVYAQYFQFYNNKITKISAFLFAIILLRLNK